MLPSPRQRKGASEWAKQALSIRLVCTLFLILLAMLGLLAVLALLRMLARIVLLVALVLFVFLLLLRVVHDELLPGVRGGKMQDCFGQHSRFLNHKAPPHTRPFGACDRLSCYARSARMVRVEVG